MVYTRDNTGRETALEYLHRGKYFGIISLLIRSRTRVIYKSDQ